MTELRALKTQVVDDDTSIDQVSKAGLVMYGLTVRYEARSTEAIKACLEFRPDLVLLDVDMPIKDGGMVASELRSHPTLRSTPVIFLTSLVTKEETGKRNALPEVFLSKQIPVAELVVRIRAVLRSETLQ